MRACGRRRPRKPKKKLWGEGDDDKWAHDRFELLDLPPEADNYMACPAGLRRCIGGPSAAGACAVWADLPVPSVATPICNLSTQVDPSSLTAQPLALERLEGRDMVAWRGRGDHPARPVAQTGPAGKDAQLCMAQGSFASRRRANYEGDEGGDVGGRRPRGRTRRAVHVVTG